jgi:hypothetical protein
VADKIADNFYLVNILVRDHDVREAIFDRGTHCWAMWIATNRKPHCGRNLTKPLARSCTH